MTEYSGIPVYVARTVQAGWFMPSVGIITHVTTDGHGLITFHGPSSQRTFALDAVVQADPHWDDDQDDDDE